MRPLVLCTLLLLLLTIQGPAGAQPGTVVPTDAFDFDKDTPEYLLIWNEVDEEFDIYEHGTAGIVQEDDPGTTGDDRSQDLDGDTYDEANYDYTSRTDFLRVGDESRTDGWLDVGIKYPYSSSDPLGDSETAGIFHDLATKALLETSIYPPAVVVALPCWADFREYPAITGPHVQTPTMWWKFSGMTPATSHGGWWGSYKTCWF